MTNTRIVLLLGRTGGGKSTLANVLINQNNNFEEVFRESAGMTSETRQNQVEKFEVNLTEDGGERIKFIVVDTVGICDTQLTEQGVLQRISGMSSHIRDGLNQILFVTGGRFTREEMKAYNLLSQILFDSQVANYTTIVHTNFPAFEDEEACERDRQALRGESLALFDILRNAKIVYVDNPPINISGSGRRIERQIELNKEIREESRKRLIFHLGNCREVYKPNNLATLNDRVANYQTEEEKMQAQVTELQQRIINQAANHQAQLSSLENRHRQDMSNLELKMKQELKDELNKKEERIKEINDKAQREQAKLQNELNKALQENSSSASGAIESTRREIVIINQSTSSALAELEEEKQASKKEQERILELEKQNLGLQIQLYGQSVAYHTEKRVREEYEKKNAEEKEQQAHIVQNAFLAFNVGGDIKVLNKLDK